MPSRTIRVDTLTRVEGEGALELDIQDGAVAGVRLAIFEPPRFFEALLRGRDASEAPDITARICGICPVAYQMSAVHAIEDALGITVDGPLRDLRRLLYCGEWIESHALHIVLLHAPDFLGFPDAISLAAVHGEAVRRGLALKKAGNAVLRLLGGREIHPVNVKVGGFYRVPSREELAPLAAVMEQARTEAIALARWVAGFRFPDFERDYIFVALRHPDEYPLNAGRVVSSGGLDIAAADYEASFVERHVAHSTALQSVLRADGGAYLVGPLARFTLNHDRLGASVQALAAELGLAPGCRNPFRSIVVRAIEVVYACEEALRLIAAYTPPPAPAVPVVPRAGVGTACTEAPRGILFHRYRLDAEGSILEARIVPPTSQNQSTIEDDLRIIATRDLELPDQELRDHCEQAIRNYDPCISCSTHFLRLEVRRQ
ncbi:MAG TPA: Ni/Fe hydrogenase subunit alpha [Acetobacteraceae bacterium]|nr:Ni/Fe hydrogenase subunit alpha [Acetobacteraceae bacterium]